MMGQTTMSLVLLLFSSLFMLPIVADDSLRKSCVDFTVPLTLTTTDLIWGRPKLESNVDLVSLIFDFNRRQFHASIQSGHRRDFMATFNPISGVQDNTRSYKIAGSYCEPFSGPRPTLLIATHGGSLDRSYWDSGYQSSNHSFVDFAVARGYSVLFYDRVGAGQSSTISGYEAQFSIHVGVLDNLIQYAKAGSIPRPNRGGLKYVPSKIVLVGHSMGSITTNALIAAKPDIADGVVLSGWEYNSGVPNVFGLVAATSQLKIANSMSRRWRPYDNGYLTFIDIFSYINIFYKVPNFDMKAVQYVFDRSWPIAVMEFFSIGALNFAPPGAKAPVLFINGEYDYIMCGGYCPGIVEPAARSFFPASVGYESYIQPNTGHILNTAPNATGTYQVITNFFSKNSL
ncbi:Alpha/Beta hydrolase protein [Rhexocercosporidium sp. MPI-PUGE-AT-0058]|nr:Alpha/Beta hydrolase protein [Rhexocercosporidium sp. MPI-PUGE-AT-0058]